MDDARAIEIGRIVAAWDGFVWAPGMLTIEGDGPMRVLAVLGDGHVRAIRLAQLQTVYPRAVGVSIGVPDLRDRPTQAGVLERIEKAVGEPCDVWQVDRSLGLWCVQMGDIEGPWHPSRAEAIAAAVEGLSR